MKDDGYDPKKSKVSADTMETWRASTINGDLKQVPGIGEAAIKKFMAVQDPANRVTNTYQLIGKYLTLKGPEDDEVEVTIGETNQKFWYYLKSLEISSHRSAIVLAISEKVAQFFPGFYDANLEQEEDEE